MKKRNKKNIHKRILLYTLLVLLTGTGVLLIQTKQSQNLVSKAAVNCSVPPLELIPDPGVVSDPSEVGKTTMFNELNNYRAQNGAGRLIQDEAALENAAQWMSNDMRAHNLLNHIDSLGRTPLKRLTDCGISEAAGGLGEAITAVAINPSKEAALSAFAEFKKSPTYNKIILDKGYTRVGIGVGGFYWTLDFIVSGQPAAPQPTSKPTTGPVPSPNCLGSCPTTPSPTSQQTMPTATQPVTQPTTVPTTAEEPPDSIPEENGQPTAPALSIPPLDTNQGQGGAPQKVKLGLLALILQFIIMLLQLILGR